MRKTALLIYGAGGHAREVVGLVRTALPQFDPVALIDDFAADRIVAQLPVIDYREAVAKHPRSAILVAVGETDGRRRLYQKVVADGFDPVALVASGTWIAPEVAVGAGTQIFPGSTLSDNVTVGKNVIINFHCSLSHDAVIGDHATLSPRVTLAGHVTIEEGVTMGAGSTVVNGTSGRRITIGAAAYVGAGACVTKDVPPGAVVVGVPARPLTRGRMAERQNLK